MRRYLLLLLTILLGGCSAESPSQMIQGTWRSDRVATLQGIDSNPTFPPKVRSLMADILGDLQLTYRDGTVSHLFEGKSTRLEYVVAREGRDWLEIEIGDAAGHEKSTTRVWVEGDRMWVRSGPPHAEFTEYFRRISR